MKNLWSRFQVWLDTPAKKRQYFYAYLCIAAAVLFTAWGFLRIIDQRNHDRCVDNAHHTAVVHTVFIGVLDILAHDSTDPNIIAVRSYLDHNLTPVEC